MLLSITNACSLVSTGYGYVTSKIMRNLADTNHRLLVEREAQLEFNFNHPNYFKFSDNPNSIKVGYVAWESTELPEGWEEIINTQLDELWVTNQFCKDVFSQYTDKPITVFGHGIDDTFAPEKKERTDKIRFLSVGHPAKRKNIPEVIESFLELYAGSKDHELTIKMYQGANNLELNEPNIKIIDRNLLYDGMRKMMIDHDILLYPSWGEGFGLIPFQAMATGTPAIITNGWSDYTHYSQGLVIDSELTENPWQKYHPGKMFKPNHEHFIKLIQNSVSNIDSLQEKQLELAYDMHKEYQWSKVVSEHFDKVESSLMV